MIITEKKVTARDVVEAYTNDGDDGIFGYSGRLTVRPSYQRNFVYDDKQRDAVVNTVMRKLPLNVMYWNKTGEDTYEVLDGQQRTISICEYVTNKYCVDVDGVRKYFYSLPSNKQDEILDYELMIYVTEGDESERLDWFRTINVCGEKLSEQELRNAAFVGEWLADAKKFFSKTGCAAAQMSDKYVKGSPIRQELLEKALSWIADKYDCTIEEYMSKHQHDANADELITYFKCVMNWAKIYFPTFYKGVTDTQKWGILYNKYHTNEYSVSAIGEDMERLFLDEEVTKKGGIVEYILAGKTIDYENKLSLRTFFDSDKSRKYKEQNGVCPHCNQHFEFSEMHGDHIVPWINGGKTNYENLQMLCQRCNNIKGGK